jgi:hypothetical protein
MAGRSLFWDKTIAEAVATDLLMFTVWQAQGLTVGQVADRMRISPELAELYEAALSRLMADLKTEAAPDSTLPGRSEAAREKAQPNNHEGVNAP